MTDTMRIGLTISAVVHAGVLLWSLVSFAAKPFETVPTDSLPVDIISATEFSQLTAGSKDAPANDKPKPHVEKIADKKPQDNPAPKVVEKPEIVATVPEPKKPEPPKPDPPKPEAKPVAAFAPTHEPKPEPKKSEPDTAVDPIAEQLKKNEAKKPEPTKPEAPKPLVQKPDPPKKPPPKFDPTKVAALLDKRDPRRMAAVGEVMNPTRSLGSPLGNAPQLSQSEIDALRAQIQACWNPPVNMADAKDLIVAVRLVLNQDGSLSGEPMVLNRDSHPLFQIAAESALRAIRRCQPYRLPIAKYEVWRDLEINFDPREMLR